MRSRAGEKIVLPAFDDNDATWQHPQDAAEGSGGTAGGGAGSAR